MKITFLGTGTSQGIPVIACDCSTCKSGSEFDKRLRTSILIEIERIKIVIDAGPDFRQQMLKEGVRKLDAILLTHEHKDHIGGMDDVRAYNFKSKKAIDIYCDKRVEEAVVREYQYVFSENRYPGVPQMNIHVFSDKPFDLFGIQIKPVLAFHHKLPVYGFRIGDLTYLTDVNRIPEESLKLIMGTKYLIVNALRKEKHLSHFNLPEALDLISQIKPDRSFITHIGHQMGLHDDVTKELPERVEFAYDGLNFEIENPDFTYSASSDSPA